MPVSLATRAKREMVTLLSNVDVGFVSLVRHGANWTPFTAIKTGTGDNRMAGQVIQSILVPTDVDVSVLKEVYGQEWLSRVKTQDADTFDHFVRFTQRSEDDFDGASFHVVDVADTGAFFVCGTLKAEKADETALAVPGPDARTKRGKEMTKEDLQGIVTQTVAQELRNVLEIELGTALKQGLERVELALTTIEKIVKACDETGRPADTDLRGALEVLAERLKSFEGELKSVVKRQESLEHTTMSRPSSPEDPPAAGDFGDDYDPAHPSRAFKGMFDRIPL
jgi:hypothetical protein